MSRKVKIELRPYDALVILSFLREYINEENRNIPEMAAIQETVDAYEKEIYKKVDLDMVEDASVENTVNRLCGRQPERPK